MFVRVAIAIIALIFLTTALRAQESPRLALLIGNQSYASKVGPLKNPHNDVNLIEASLKQLGFKVTMLKDASYKVMDSTLKRYVTEVRRAGRSALSFFYYSGHGVANPETQINYLIPVDVTDAEDDKVWFESFQQTAIIDLLSRQAPNATHYVVFDACRNELNIAGTAAKALGTDKGFVPVTDTAGLLIAYATAPRKTASDVGEGGGPYAKVLADELVKPGIEAVAMFRNVQLRVKQTIGQDPWLSFPSLPAVYFAGSKPPGNLELTFWNSVKDSTNPAVLKTYLDSYPNGEFVSIARILIEQYDRKLKLEEAARDEERKRREEARKTAEVKRLEEEQRTREAILAQQRRQAEVAKNSDEARRAEKARAELKVRTEELHRALEDARIAREAARGAEEQRLAAIKAAEEATKQAAAIEPPQLRDELALRLAIQQQLKRVGCYEGAVDGAWGANVKQALANFSKFSKLDLRSDQPTEAILQTVTSKSGRICVPTCWGPGEKFINGKCVVPMEPDGRASGGVKKRVVAKPQPKQGKPKLCHIKPEGVNTPPTMLISCDSPRALRE